MCYWIELLFCILMCALPTAFCVLVWRKSPLVSSLWRILLCVAAVSVLGGVAGWLESAILEGSPKTPALLACGSASVWIWGVPIFLCSFILRTLFEFGWWVREKVARRKIERGKPIWGVVILLALSLVVYPPCLMSVLRIDNPRRCYRTWNDWDERQYRVRVEDRIVHMQIRDGESVADVRTDASAVHGFWIYKNTKDELMLNSSDVGHRFVGKVDGRWRCYYLQNDEKVFVDGE